jgi:hypothetical protein
MRLTGRIASRRARRAGAVLVTDTRSFAACQQRPSSFRPTKPRVMLTVGPRPSALPWTMQANGYFRGFAIEAVSRPVRHSVSVLATRVTIRGPRNFSRLRRTAVPSRRRKDAVWASTDFASCVIAGAGSPAAVLSVSPPPPPRNQPAG